MANDGAHHMLRATPDTCYWGYIDRDQPAALSIAPGDVVEVEAVTHHAGDAPDLLMDDDLRTLWAAIPPEQAGARCARHDRARSRCAARARATRSSCV